MGYGLTQNLQWIAIGLFIACTYCASRDLPLRWAIGIAAFRVTIVIGYFAWYYDGIWTLRDDLEYIEQGYLLLNSGYSPLTILCPKGIKTLQDLAGGGHFFYIWWTYAWMWILGDYYYSPVIGNVLITFISGHTLSKLLAEAGFEKLYRNVVVGFYLLHWDTISWPSFLNLKDALVQLLTISAFLYTARCLWHKSLISAIQLAAVLLLFQSIRFYVPALMAAGLGIWLLFESRDPIKILMFTAIGLVVAIYGPWYHFQDSLNPLVLVRNSLRFALTPQPWAIHENYSFLFLPSIAHWIFFLPAMAGAIALCHESRLFRLLALYGLVILVFYAAIDDLQDVRHRLQISFIFVWAQIHFTMKWFFATVTAPLHQANPNQHYFPKLKTLPQ